MTGIRLFFEGVYVSKLGKQQVSYSCSKAYSQEEPSVECHRNQHEEVAQPNLDHVENRLEQVHSNAQGIILNTECACGCGECGVCVREENKM